MVYFCVYFADWVTSEAGFVRFLMKDVHLSLNGALLILLTTIVGTLVYGALDILKLAEVKIGNTTYGIVPWLKQPRVKWVHEYDNVAVVALATIVHILEDGFSLFAAAPAAKKEDTKQFDSDEDGEVVLRIENNIKKDKVAQYHKWREQFTKMGCHARPGMVSVKSNADPEGTHYVTYIVFDSVNSLNEFMTSPIRQRMVSKLQPLLDTPQVDQISKERILPDALTDLAHGQGQSVPKLLPKKWKVWTITTMGLWFVILIANATLSKHYYVELNLTDAHTRWQALVRIGFNTFLNVYVFTPFCTLLFGQWMVRKPDEVDVLEPWRTLNDGFSTTCGKLFLTLTFYGTFALIGIVQKHG